MGRSSRPIKDPRHLAVACMAEVEKEGILVPQAMVRLVHALNDVDRAFAHEVVYGGFRFLPGLDHQLSSFCKKKKLPPKIYWILISALYQLHFMRTPPYAVIDEANRLASRLGFPGLKGLVNGVLRNAMRRGSCQSRELSRWLLPPWMTELFTAQYGDARLKEWLNAWRERTTIAYWSRSDRPFGEDRPSEFLPHAFLRQVALPRDLLANEPVYIQNETSQAIAEMVCRSGASSVLDPCAAPGGKACYISAFGAVRRLVACDSDPERMARLAENRAKLGLDFETRNAAVDQLDLSPGSFDLVLLDAPCTGIGIIGRHPEIKFLKKSAADEPLRRNQAALLARAWFFVKPGGFLLYSVCSLDRNELPAPPADASPAGQELEAWLPANLPVTVQGASFSFSPSSRFDGFLGMLLKKG